MYVLYKRVTLNLVVLLSSTDDNKNKPKRHYLNKTVESP